MSRTSTSQRARELVVAFWQRDEAPLHHDINTRLNGLRDDAMRTTAYQALLGQVVEDAVHHGVLRWRNGTKYDPPSWLKPLLTELAEFVHVQDHQEEA